MASVYTRHGYTWAPGSRVRIDADATAKALEAIERECGTVPLEEIVKRARDPKSPLHAHFEWDNADAAHQWRLDQAGHILRSIRYRLVNTRTEDETVGERVYQPVRTVTDDMSRPGEYLRVTTVRTEEPAPRAHVPTKYTVRTTPAPRPQRPDAAAQPTTAPMQPVATLVMKPSRETARTVLMGWADALADDPYFVDVVAAIRALP